VLRRFLAPFLHELHSRIINVGLHVYSLETARHFQDA
jgi:hypothetical protein